MFSERTLPGFSWPLPAGPSRLTEEQAEQLTGPMLLRVLEKMHQRAVAAERHASIAVDLLERSVVLYDDLRRAMQSVPECEAAIHEHKKEAWGSIIERSERRYEHISLHGH